METAWRAAAEGVEETKGGIGAAGEEDSAGGTTGGEGGRTSPTNRPEPRRPLPAGWVEEDVVGRGAVEGGPPPEEERGLGTMEKREVTRLHAARS